MGYNFRPITYLSHLWKTFAGVLAEELYRYLGVNNLLPQEQKGCPKGSRDIKDQLMIGKMIRRDCKND